VTSWEERFVIFKATGFFESVSPREILEGVVVEASSPEPAFA